MLRVEARQNDVPRTNCHERQHLGTAPMSQRRAMDHGRVARRHDLVRQHIDHSGDTATLSMCCALGPTGGSAGVKHVGRMIRRNACRLEDSGCAIEYMLIVLDGFVSTV